MSQELFITFSGKVGLEFSFRIFKRKFPKCKTTIMKNKILKIQTHLSIKTHKIDKFQMFVPFDIHESKGQMILEESSKFI